MTNWLIITLSLLGVVIISFIYMGFAVFYFKNKVLIYLGYLFLVIILVALVASFIIPRYGVAYSVAC